MRLMDACRPIDDDCTGMEKDNSYPELVTRRVWLASQKGFLVAAYCIGSDLPYAKIFGSIRIEAIKNIDKKDLALLATNESKNLGALYTELAYTESQLKDIFALNVARTDQFDLSNDAADDPQVRLFGFRDINHSRVYGATEEILCLMLRHTFGSARDLVLIAKNAKNAATASQRNSAAGIEAILKSINSSAVGLCNDWMNDVVPGFSTKLDVATRMLHRNTFTTLDIETIELSIGYPGLFSALFSRGLVGYPVLSNTQQAFCLDFHRPDGNDHILPTGVPYFALHPALSAWICEKSSDKSIKNKFYTSNFIVGQGLPCPSSLVEPKLFIDVESSGDWTIKAHALENDFSGSQLSTKGENQSRSILLNRRLKLLLLPLILMRWRNPSKEVFEQSDFNFEMQRLLDIGLFRVEDKQIFQREVTKFFFTKSESHAAINFAAIDLGIAIHFEKDEVNDKSAIRGCNLMWREGSAAYKNWTPLKGCEIQVFVKQSRVGIFRDLA